MKILFLVLLMAQTLFAFNLYRQYYFVSSELELPEEEHVRVQRHLIQMPERNQPWKTRPRYPWEERT